MSEVEFTEVVLQAGEVYVNIWKDDKEYSYLPEDIIDAMENKKLAALQARVKELEVNKEAMLNLLSWILDDGEGGKYRGDINQVLVQEKNK